MKQFDTILEQAFAEPPQKISRWPDPIMNFLIAYDVAEPKRLRLVAKHLEMSARRVQKSVFMFTGSRHQLDALLAAVVQDIDPTADRVQAWPIRTSSRACRVDLGLGAPETGVALIVMSDQWTVIEAIDEPNEADHEPMILS